jgi:hypothetical protein
LTGVKRFPDFIPKKAISSCFIIQGTDMGTVELEAQKAELAREILGETNEEIVKKVMLFFRSTKAEPERLMTVDELRAEVRQSEKDYGNGLGITTEEMLKKHPEWR